MISGVLRAGARASQHLVTGSQGRWLVGGARGMADRPKTAVVMLNMGGPSTLDEVEFFLTNLFTDREIIPLGPLQKWLGPYISKRRTPRIQKQYAEIGGGSPIGRWSEIQGARMAALLDELSPESAPHKHYVAFRYANPLTEHALRQMKQDGVRRAVAFSQYPQFSCTTTGSSLNHLWRELRRMGLGDDFDWSVIDRWPDHPTFVQAVAKRVQEGLEQFSPDVRDQVVLLFSAHSVPMRVVNRGDQYVQEVAATVQAVVNAMGRSNKYILSWQSKVGFLPWMGPPTGDVLQGLGRQQHKHVLAVPIAFTTDHVETLYEIDIEYAEVAHKAGIEHFARAPSLNDEPLAIRAMAEIVADHLKRGEVCTPQYGINCADCVNPTCRTIIKPVGEYTRLRDKAAGLTTPSTVADLQ